MDRQAAEILALRANDGTGAPNTCRPFTSPGVYVPTALPVSSEWPEVEPWLMTGGAQFGSSRTGRLTPARQRCWSGTHSWDGGSQRGERGREVRGREQGVTPPDI